LDAARGASWALRAVRLTLRVAQLDACEGDFDGRLTAATSLAAACVN